MPTAPNAAWIEKFAARLIQLRPTTHPLDAVRCAMQEFPRVTKLDPREAAEDIASGWPNEVGAKSAFGSADDARHQ